ncbi:adenylate/guanylate cyclase domain-containing protein [Haloferax volcanii]|uniref:Adenylate/guanylate cyclase domain-containing protein n=1 Tax=Haloferax volcanii TaxID=2246 RepID=A0A6C0UZ31_HALVO|nr:adenylate/guanylate cyclase domain-containing protein [Haloferax alexandrinus]QIB79069.1 adenylate/guanylate cyclase domain-containing protein [Haloferax alexandrinus]
MGWFSDSKKEDIEERITERADTIEERHDHIPRGRTTPRLDSLSLHSAKRYRLGMIFIDINDFSGYMSRNDDEDTLFMLNLFIPEAMELVRDFEGKLEKNTGDGILAYFGAGDSDQEAVENLLEYIATLKWALANHINPILEEENIETISISGGAAYDLVHISRIGAHSGNQQMNRLTAVSTGANIASELEDMAGTNEYFVNDGIYQYSDKENGWGQFVHDRGVHTGYLWADETAHYYNFSGIWTDTDTENLE